MKKPRVIIHRLVSTSTALPFLIPKVGRQGKSRGRGGEPDAGKEEEEDNEEESSKEEDNEEEEMT